MKALIGNELDIDQIEQVYGGTVNENMTPDDHGLDSIINDGVYDAIAQLIADWLNGDLERSRNVQNDIDIFACDI